MSLYPAASPGGQRRGDRSVAGDLSHKGKGARFVGDEAGALVAVPMPGNGRDMVIGAPSAGQGAGRILGPP